MDKLLRVALLQTKCIGNKAANLQFIKQAMNEAGKNKAQMCVLGQICNSPYDKKYMREYAEEIENSETLRIIQEQTKQHKMYAVCTIPERAKTGKLYNTGLVVSPKGDLLAKMSKLHLFDIDIPGKITYKESEVFQAGSDICVFQTEWGKMGLGICYDIRFAELALAMRNRGAKMLFFPGSFNQTTGPLHWQLLLRGRALDTQCYVAGVSTAQNKQDTTVYQAWGHSTLVDPFGKVLIAMDQNPSIQYFDVDFGYLEQVRQQIPISKQKRHDLYELRDSKL